MLQHRILSETNVIMLNMNSHHQVDEQSQPDEEGEEIDGQLGRVASAEDAVSAEVEKDGGENAGTNRRCKPGQEDWQDTPGPGEVSPLGVPLDAVLSKDDQSITNNGSSD